MNAATTHFERPTSKQQTEKTKYYKQTQRCEPFELRVHFIVGLDFIVCDETRVWTEPTIQPEWQARFINFGEIFMQWFRVFEGRLRSLRGFTFWWMTFAPSKNGLRIRQKFYAFSISVVLEMFWKSVFLWVSITFEKSIQTNDDEYSTSLTPPDFHLFLVLYCM